MNFLNRFSRNMYSLLGYFISGIIFLTCTVPFLFIISALDSSSFFRNTFSSGMILSFQMSKVLLIVLFILAVLIGFLISILSSSIKNFLDKSYADRGISRSFHISSLLKGNKRLQGYHKKICDHYEINELEIDFLIKESNFYDKTNPKNMNSKKSLCLYDIFRNCVFSFSIILVMLFVLILFANYLPFTLLLLLILAVVLIYISSTKSKKYYKEYIEDCYYVVYDHISKEE